MFGDLSKKLSDFSERINSLRVRVEAEIDFSDEGQDFMDGSLFNDLSLLIEDFGSFDTGLAWQPEPQLAPCYSFEILPRGAGVPASEDG